MAPAAARRAPALILSHTRERFTVSLLPCATRQPQYTAEKVQYAIGSRSLSLCRHIEGKHGVGDLGFRCS